MSQKQSLLNEKNESSFQAEKDKLEAMDKNYAIIEFLPDGTILEANANFLAALGYSLSEIVNKHHRIFCSSDITQNISYKQFWNNLAAGKSQVGEFKRVKKTGEKIWIQASYTPIIDKHGNVAKVIKFAQDITDQKLKTADYEGQIAAIDKSQAVIEFNLDGTIITANQNFLDTLNYSLNEIQGRHHRMFCEQDYVNSVEYRQFWERLNQGEFDMGQYKRIGANGKVVYIQASYNPIKNSEGEVYKVVKYATDLTEEKLAYNNLVDSFDQASQELLTNSKSLSAAATQMSTSAQGTLEQSLSASTAAQNVSHGVASVGTSTEEMSASIKDIATSAAKSSEISNDAKDKSDEANKNIQELGDASEEIGKVVKVISSIAQQTNLLALNATIEAARAGEAGKGFAVVANEVKELAKQTAVATEDISHKIQNVQNSTQSSITIIHDIASIIDDLNSIATSTAASVEEQAVTTNEVSRVLVDSSNEVSNISNLIQSVSVSAEENSQGASQVLESATKLNELSTQLQDLVNKSRKA
ncbi:MAG: PAS domain-containing methyl-accepting chemotaxis protein [Bacteriovoracaceae bacterium]|jgi:methyl-accepting chemotaxis protein|nr:PAS domain-containing methyl-accepting chemotaxis protein [Bacteriovoracaceae bacterium]